MTILDNEHNLQDMVNALKFQTLSLFPWINVVIKVGNCKMLVRIAACAVFLHLFNRQLVFKIVDIYRIQFNYANVQQQ